MKLIVGLGNEGKKFLNTRHNIGFMILDNLAKQWNVIFIKELKFKGYISIKIIDNEKIILLKPTTFMNLSGESVKKIIDYYKINIKDVLIIYDDLYLKIGSKRFKEKGSSGGQKGMENIINCLKTNIISRFKIGIGLKIDKIIEKKNYVLGEFNKKNQKIINKIIKESEKDILIFIKKGIKEAMNITNKKENG